MSVAKDGQLSVVMVTLNAWEHTERALAAVRRHTPMPLELVVVDNGSTDATVERLSGDPGIRLIRNAANRGFGPASNQGAERASGEWLLLLNSDAFVHAGWFEPLREALVRGAGAAVPRFLYPDGRLQEAGALIARDGTVAVLGDGADPTLPVHRFRRIVDCGSAACMLLRGSAFAALGGFDPLFAPAYYEDTDLCLRLAAGGAPVVLVPRSTVTHVRYGSSDPTAAARLSAANRRRFAERWGERLPGRPVTLAAAGPETLLWARDALATPRVLILAPAAEGLAADILGRWPRARVTWAARGSAPESALAAGVEVLGADDLGDWLPDRRFHYDLVVTDDDGQEPIARVTQPQAAWLAVAKLAGAASRATIGHRLASAGIAPATD